MTRTPLRLFVIYAGCFVAALGLAWVVLTVLLDQIAEGQWVLLLLPPLAGMALFHGLFPLVARLRLGTEFLLIGGGLVYGLGAVLAAAVWAGLLNPGIGVVFWLVGTFGPGWWILLGWAERVGYFR